MDLLNITGNLIDNIESGLYDDFIEEELKKEENKSIFVYSPDYLDWVLDKVNNANSHSFYDDEVFEEGDKDNVSLLSSLYYFLINKLGFVEDKNSDKEGFEHSSVYFKYKNKVIRMSKIYSDNSVIFGISLDINKKDVEEIEF